MARIKGLATKNLGIKAMNSLQMQVIGIHLFRLEINQALLANNTRYKGTIIREYNSQNLA